MGLVLPRLSVIVSSSLAQTLPGVPNRTVDHEGTCANLLNPCTELHDSVNHTMVLVPFGIALLFFTVGALPVMLLRCRHRVLGVRSCLWVLIELWVHLMATHIMFRFDRAQAYVWALHAAVHVLASWQPRRGVMPYPGLQRAVSLAGVCAVAVYAWQYGPPVGLAAWYSRTDAQCGWKVHLTAVIGMELIGGVLWPLEGAVVGGF